MWECRRLSLKQTVKSQLITRKWSLLPVSRFWLLVPWLIGKQTRDNQMSTTYTYEVENKLYEVKLSRRLTVVHYLADTREGDYRQE